MNPRQPPGNRRVFDGRVGLTTSGTDYPQWPDPCAVSNSPTRGFDGAGAGTRSSRVGSSLGPPGLGGPATVGGLHGQPGGGLGHGARGTAG